MTKVIYYIASNFFRGNPLFSIISFAIFAKLQNHPNQNQIDSEKITTFTKLKS